MIPRQSKLGKNFKGAGAYYLQDPSASTSERVAFTHTENIPTQDAHKALKWMAWTAIHAEELKREAGVQDNGQCCTKPVFTLSLAWHPEQEPHKWEMIGAGRRALIALGLEEHETLMVAHNDTDHPHLHLIVNTVHPETGRVNRLSYSKLKLSKWAEEYEREHGRIYCDQRVENNEQRAQEDFVKYEEPELDRKALITQLYHASDSGKAFQQALQEAGFKLAQGKRVVVIDEAGKIHSLSRQIEGINAKQIRAKLTDLVLPSVDEARGSVDGTDHGHDPKSDAKNGDPKAREDAESEYFDRDQQDRDWQESIIDAAIVHKRTPRPKPVSQPTPALLNTLQDRQLAELGEFYQMKFQARNRLEERLAQQYDEHERNFRGKAAHLEQALNNSGPLQLLWLKVSRQIPWSAEEDLRNLQRTIENIEWRRAEANRRLESEMHRRREEIEARHRRERLELQPNHDFCIDESYEAPEHGPDDEDVGPALSY